jgi:hypothetical protein
VRHLVVQALLDADLDAAERVDEVGEADEVDERVVVDPDREQVRNRLLQRGRPVLAAAVEAEDRVQRLLRQPPLLPERHLGKVAGDAERGGPARAVLEGGKDDRVRPRAPVAGALVGAEQEDRRPRLRGRGLRLGDDARVGVERCDLARPEPLDERPLPCVLRHPLRERTHHVRQQDGAAVAGGTARLLVGEDALEHVVAPDRDPGGRHMGCGGQGDECGDEERNRSLDGVDDCEHAEGE